jgi:hypothetical protein
LISKNHGKEIQDNESPYQRVPLTESGPSKRKGKKRSTIGEDYPADGHLNSAVRKRTKSS